MIDRMLARLPILLAIVGCLAAVPVLLPNGILQPLGAVVRSAEDFTPDRLLRLRLACGLLSALLIGSAIATKRHPLIWRTAPPLDVRSGAVAGPTWWGIVLLTLLAFILRWRWLFEPMAYDESYTYVNFASQSLPFAIGNYNSTNNHLLNTASVWLTTRLFGPQEWAIRLPVFLLGSLLPALVVWWGREWRSTWESFGAAILVATSPMLITYSTDARGYMFVIVFAVLLDGALARLLRDRQRGDLPSSRWWVLAWLAMTFGLSSMPLMVYAILGSFGWYLLRSTEGVSRRERLFDLAKLTQAAAVPVLIFYTPAFIFRGFAFLRDPIMQSTSANSFALDTLHSWGAAGLWTLRGGVPWPVWIAPACVGVFVLLRDRDLFPRWMLLPLAVLTVNLIKGVAPPPRIFMHLSPWIFLAVAIGAVWIVESLTKPVWRPALLGSVAFVVIAWGSYDVFTKTVLFFPEDRTGYVSIRDLMTELEHQIAEDSDGEHVLLAPLPVDLPSIFYRDRAGLTFPVNRRPQPNETVWLIVPQGQTIAETLDSGLLRMPALEQTRASWVRVYDGKTLSLYRGRSLGDE